MPITPHTPVGQLAAMYPPSMQVLDRHGIDYSHGAGELLRTVCDERGLDVEALLGEIRNEIVDPEVLDEHWDEAPLPELIEHILVAYHEPLREELPRLESMARTLLDANGSRDGKRLSELLAVFLRLRAELEQHMAKEEQMLFPLILGGYGDMAGGPITRMEEEHDSARLALRRLHQLTNGYDMPPEACSSWRPLWHGLAALEESLHRHIQLENEILFPRALAG